MIWGLFGILLVLVGTVWWRRAAIANTLISVLTFLTKLHE